MDDQIIIDIQLEAGDFVKKAAEIQERINKLKQANKDLQKQVEEGAITQKEANEMLEANKVQIKNLTAEYNTYSRSAQGVLSVDIDLNGSLSEMRRNLANAKAAYAALSKEQRENADVGGKLLEHIQQLDSEVKATEATMGDFQRNVGNYPKTITAIIPGFDKLSNAVTALGGNLSGGFVSAMKTAGTSVVSFGKMLLTTPLGWIAAALAVVVGALSKLGEAFKKNDDAGTAMSKLFASLQPIITLVGKAFDGLAVVIGKVANAIANVIAMFSDSAKAAQELVTATDALQDKEREYTENSARRNKEIAEIRDKAAQSDKYTAEERIKLLEDAAALEKQNLEEQKAIVAERLRLLEAEAKQNNDSSDEMKDKIATARAAMYQAEEQYYSGTRRLQQQLTAARKEVAATEKSEQDAAIKRAAEYRKKREEIAKSISDIERQVEDIYISMITDSTERAVEQRKVQGEREIAELKSRTARTAEERESLAKLITAKEQQLANDIAAIRQQAADEASKQAEAELQATQERENKRLQILLEAATKNSEEYYNIRRQIQQRSLEQELADETLTEEEKLAIQKKYLNLGADLDREQSQAETARKLEALQTEWSAIAAAQEANMATEVEREGEHLRQLQEQKNLIREEDYNTYAEYAAKMAEVDSAIVASKRNIEVAQAKESATLLSSMSSVTSALSDVIGEFAGENEDLAAFQKALTLFNIGVSTAQAIAAGTAQAMSVPFPANIAAIATTTATVIANIATAFKTLKGAGNAPKFATGGIVGGTSYSGDRVQARVNSGEMILTMQQQKQLFEIANSKQPAGIDYELLGATMAAAVAEQPAPVMDYSEFMQFQKNVATYKEITRI